MMDTAKQKVDNLTKQADQLLVDPPEVTVMKEDVKISTPQIANSTPESIDLNIDETVSTNIPSSLTRMSSA